MLSCFLGYFRSGSLYFLIHTNTILLMLCPFSVDYFLGVNFSLKTTFEDVFPVEATSVEEYLQQVIFTLNCLLIIWTYYHINS